MIQEVEIRMRISDACKEYYVTLRGKMTSNFLTTLNYRTPWHKSVVLFYWKFVFIR